MLSNWGFSHPQCKQGTKVTVRVRPSDCQRGYNVGGCGWWDCFTGCARSKRRDHHSLVIAFWPLADQPKRLRLPDGASVLLMCTPVSIRGIMAILVCVWELANPIDCTAHPSLPACVFPTVRKGNSNNNNNCPVNIRENSRGKKRRGDGSKDTTRRRRQG